MLATRYPIIAANMSEYAKGLLHLEMADLARATQAAIDDGDRETVRDHFGFVNEVYGNAAPDVENAVNVSYLENLRFEGRQAKAMKARELLTPKLRQALEDLERYLARLFNQ